MRYATPPDVPLFRALFKRGTWNGEIPAIEALCDSVPPPPEAYAALCAFPAIDPSPITWPAVACNGLQLAVMMDAHFPLPILGIVHTRQTIVRKRHLRPAEALRARCRTAGHRVVRSGGEFDLALEIEGADGVVWSGTSTILSRVIPGSGGPKRDPPAPPAWVDARESTLEVPADSGWRYAAVSRDYNPIHLAAYTSFAFGFRRPIAHGWFMLARALAAAGDQVPEACSIDARFVGVVEMPGKVSLKIGKVMGDDRLRLELSTREPCLVATVEG